MREPSRLAPVIRVVVLVGVLAAMLGLAAAVGRPRLAATEIPLSPARTYAADDPNGLGGIVMSLPARWRVETSVAPLLRGGVLLTAKENGSAPRPGTNLAPEGPRTLTVEVYPQTSVLPPRTFIQERLGIRQPVERTTVAGQPAVLTGVAYNVAGRRTDVETTANWAFDLVAAATMPSGRVLVVRLKGPGRGSAVDAQVLRRVIETMRVGESAGSAGGAGGAGLGSDALDSLRVRPVTSPIGLLAEWSAGREASGPKLKHVAVVPLPGDIVTLELFPVYLPPAPTDADMDDLSEHPAVTASIAMAAAHDARLMDAVVRRLSPTRLLLSADPGTQQAGRTPRAPVSALVVFPDNAQLAPLAALLVARGESDGRTDLARQLNRAADRLVFAPHSDELTQLLLTGQRLAELPTPEAPEEDILPLFAATARPSADDVPEVLVRFAADGTVDARRGEPAPQRLLRAERAGPGSTLSVSLSRQVRFDDTYSDVLSRQFTVPPRVPAEPGTEPPNIDLLSPSRYVRGHQLFTRAALAGSRAALVVTDAVAPIDLDTESLFSFVLVQSLSGPRDQRRFALHPLGSGRVLVAEFGVRGELLTLEEPGRVQTRRDGRGGARRGVQHWREDGGR